MEVSDKAAVLEQMNQALENGIVPHNSALGMSAVDVADGMAVFKLPYAEHLIGNPETGVLHGGAISALLDATCGMAVILKMNEHPRIATIDLRIDYMGPAEPGQAVLGRAECYKLTRHIAFTRAVAYHRDPKDPIAAAAGTFMIFGEGKSPTGKGVEAR